MNQEELKELAEKVLKSAYICGEYETDTECDGSFYMVRDPFDGQKIKNDVASLADGVLKLLDGQSLEERIQQQAENAQREAELYQRALDLFGARRRVLSAVKPLEDLANTLLEMSRASGENILSDCKKAAEDIPEALSAAALAINELQYTIFGEYPDWEELLLHDLETKCRMEELRQGKRKEDDDL